MRYFRLSIGAIHTPLVQAPKGRHTIHSDYLTMTVLIEPLKSDSKHTAGGAGRNALPKDESWGPVQQVGNPLSAEQTRTGGADVELLGPGSWPSCQLMQTRPWPSTAIWAKLCLPAVLLAICRSVLKSILASVDGDSPSHRRPASRTSAKIRSESLISHSPPS